MQNPCNRYWSSKSKRSWESRSQKKVLKSVLIEESAQKGQCVIFQWRPLTLSLIDNLFKCQRHVTNPASGTLTLACRTRSCTADQSKTWIETTRFANPFDSTDPSNGATWPYNHLKKIRRWLFPILVWTIGCPKRTMWTWRTCPIKSQNTSLQKCL